MRLGWSDSGRPTLRATNGEREEVRRILDIARSEGRLDAALHMTRTDAVFRTARTRRDLAALTADLPVKRGVRQWLPGARPLRRDRELALRLINEGLTAGRLSAEHHARRLQTLATVATYRDLGKVLAGLPGWPSVRDRDLLATAADRTEVRAELDRSVIDGRVPLTERESHAARIDRVGRVVDLNAILKTLRAYADDTERAAAAALIEKAYLDGRFDLEERDLRLELAAEATLDSELAGLVVDLHGPDRRPGREERDEIAAKLKAALDLGRLTLEEYDGRLEDLYKAQTLQRTELLLADLIEPDHPARRGPLDRAFDALVVNSALLAQPPWWLRWYPKVFWKTASIIVLLLWGWAIVAYPSAIACIVGGGWMPLALILSAIIGASRGNATDVKHRQRMVIAKIGAMLRESGNGIREVRLALKDRIATVEVDFNDYRINSVPPKIVEEAVRLIWLSRLYPIKTVKVQVLHKSEHAVLQTFGEPGSQELSHRYGPRPYGRISDTTDDSWKNLG